MNKKIDIEEFFKLAESLPVVDVRTPMEFLQGHIPDAVNIALFTDEERAQVGTEYKQTGKDNALMIGLDIVGPKMTSFVKVAKKVAINNRLLIHCWRGGMRSSSMAWLFNIAGIKTYILNDGYKSYRRHARNNFEKEAKILILSGNTGSGKTDLLLEMKKLGEQVIDLEGLANHKGSSFGAIGQKSQPTTEQFENYLFAEWRKLDLKKRIWLEDESLNIGRVIIPEPLFNKMRETKVLRLLVDKQQRIDRLVKDYTGIDHKLLVEAVLRIKKRLGGLNLKLCLEALEKKDYATVADLSLQYYDKAYEFGLSNREKQSVHFLEIKNDVIVENAKLIINFVQERALA